MTVHGREPRCPSRPTDDAIVLAALARGGEWLMADEIRGSLSSLGFEARTQQVAAWLGRLSREDDPMFERRKGWFDELEYRVTRFGRTQINNRFRGLTVWEAAHA